MTPKLPPKTRLHNAEELRALAVEKDRNNALNFPEIINALTPLEIEGILHELRVHQIELEMQNEELRTREAELEESRALYTDLYDLAPLSYLTLSAEGLILQANLTAATLLQVPRASLLNQPFTRFISKSQQDAFYQKRNALFNTQLPQECELLLNKTDGSHFWAKITATSAQDSSGNPTCLMVFGDVTAHKLSAMILAARSRLLLLAQSLTHADLLRATLDEAEILTDSTIGFYHFVDADQNALHLQAWSTHTTQHLCSAEGMAGQHYPVDQAGAWADCIRKGSPVIHNDYASIPNRNGLPPGHAIVTRELVVPVIRNEKITAILGVGNKPNAYGPLDIQAISALADLAWDITGAMQAQDALKTSLHEKEVLLKEVHHRVKNNLQIMSSLLHLQADHSTDANVKDALKEMQNRVLSMALIHSHLYQSNNLASVEMADYLKTLCEQLLKSLTASHSPIQLHLELDRAQLEIDQAIPCGLLANELITNALKHAFPNDRRGQLHISLRHNPLDSKIHFSVTDDGIGLPPDFSLDSLSSLGLQVSVNLARQLGGELRILPTTQTAFEVAFPLNFH